MPNIVPVALSVREWCAANNVKPERLWYWLRRYRTEKDTCLREPNQWLPVKISDHLLMEEDSPLRIKVGAACIEVKPGFDPAVLSQVIRILTATIC